MSSKRYSGSRANEGRAGGYGDLTVGGFTHGKHLAQHTSTAASLGGNPYQPGSGEPVELHGLDHRLGVVEHRLEHGNDVLHSSISFLICSICRSICIVRRCPTRSDAAM